MTPAERRDFLWELVSGILWSFAITALWIWTDAGMFAFASIALVMLPAIASCLFNAVFRPPQRTFYLAKAAIWFCAAALTALWIKYADDFAQTRALEAAAKIEKFHAEQGRWPDSLAAVGVEQEGRPRLYYFPPNPPAQPQPFLFYPAFTRPFDRYFYDFDRRRFEFQPD
ncbi:hypothetical protein [Neisseria bacilliformis]|uniref:hypothetical protein n=1 Tax=Neisseria bacilliformis TaxID=267212 RepID=UPI0028EF7D60|nr:hypothetical protein [Neisseria bacilliformis]